MSKEDQGPATPANPAAIMSDTGTRRKLPNEAQRKNGRENIQQDSKCVDELRVTTKQLADEQDGKQVENVESMRILVGARPACVAPTSVNSEQ
jgi:hypothetical protein